MASTNGIRHMTADDVSEVTSLFAEVFASREPLSKHLHIRSVDLMGFGRAVATEAAEHGLSLVRVADQDSIRAVNISVPYGIVITDDSSQVAPILALLDSQTDKWKTSHLEMSAEEMLKKVVYFVPRGVRDGIEGKDEARRLLEASLDHAKQMGRTLVMAHATAAGSQRLFENLGFKKVVETKYADFEFNGTKVFEGVMDPLSCVTYEKNLE